MKLSRAAYVSTLLFVSAACDSKDDKPADASTTPALDASTLLDANAVGWDSLGANLTDGSALMAFKVRSRDGHAVWAHAAFRKPDGGVTTFGPDQVDFTPLRTWRSPRTNTSYPVSMTVKTGTRTWKLDPLMDDQELDSRQSTGAVYWEGAVRVSREGVDVGRAYLELTGYANALRMGRD